MVRSNSLANLRPAPAFAPGHKSPRRSADVDRAITRLRKSAPDAVDFCIKLLHDENADPALRTKVALAIIDKTMPNSDPRLHISSDTIGALRIVFVSPGEQPEAPVIDMDDGADR
jgi:hypothetical protein